jgi:hypothetical protein
MFLFVKESYPSLEYVKAGFGNIPRPKLGWLTEQETLLLTSFITVSGVIIKRQFIHKRCAAMTSFKALDFSYMGNAQ